MCNFSDSVNADLGQKKLGNKARPDGGGMWWVEEHPASDAAVHKDSSAWGQKLCATMQPHTGWQISMPVCSKQKPDRPSIHSGMQSNGQASGLPLVTRLSGTLMSRPACMAASFRSCSFFTVSLPICSSLDTWSSTLGISTLPAVRVRRVATYARIPVRGWQSMALEGNWLLSAACRGAWKHLCCLR